MPLLTAFTVYNIQYPLRYIYKVFIPYLLKENKRIAHTKNTRDRTNDTYQMLLLQQQSVLRIIDKTNFFNKVPPEHTYHTYPLLLLSINTTGRQVTRRRMTYYIITNTPAREDIMYHITRCIILQSITIRDL